MFGLGWSRVVGGSVDVRAIATCSPFLVLIIPLSFPSWRDVSRRRRPRWWDEVGHVGRGGCCMRDGQGGGQNDAFEDCVEGRRQDRTPLWLLRHNDDDVPDFTPHQDCLDLHE